MKRATELVIENLAKLRKACGLTQMELSQKINYSDKTISRWEKGEVIPSIEVLEKLAEIYKVSVSYFFEEHLEQADVKVEEQKFNLHLSIMFSLILVVWTVAVLIFFTLNKYIGRYYFEALVWALPITTLVIGWCSKNYFNKKLYLLTRSFACWFTLGAIYVQFLNQNLWTIFFFGIPMQITLILFSYLNKIGNNKKKRNITAEKIEKFFSKKGK